MTGTVVTAETTKPVLACVNDVAQTQAFEKADSFVNGFLRWLRRGRPVFGSTPSGHAAAEGLYVATKDGIADDDDGFGHERTGGALGVQHPITT